MSDSALGRTLRKMAVALPWPGLLAALLALAFVQTNTWRGLELVIYDRLLVASAPGGRVELPITLVGIDEASFAHLGKAWPWPREWHARILDRLREAGVVIAAFDVLFAEATDEKGDAAFAEAIQRFDGGVVLASDQVYSETALVKKWENVEPLARFRQAGAVSGFASVEIDADGVLRRVPTHEQAFWRQIVLSFDARIPGVAERISAQEGERIRYFGGAQTFTYIPFYLLLDEQPLSPEFQAALRDNIVLVGRNLKASTEVHSVQNDMFQTPFFAADRQLMPGVEVHANLVASMIAGNTLVEADRRIVLLFSVALAGIALWAMREWRPLPAMLVFLGLLAVVALVEAVSFFRHAFWLPSAGGAFAVFAVYLSQGGQAYLALRRQREEIKRAFALYVAPDLVEQIVAHPERLLLGGERRELTLLFTDIAGFTELAESMPVERVARLLNQHLSEMTAIILAHGGTVDKFIGDAVMAFWGAPLAAPDGERSAVRAAIAMQARMAALRASADSDGVALHMRIGIHRGECIVGNLGGDKRFDYTAIGDVVNLASRLEGANKEYGTSILLSSAVAQYLGDDLPLREIDTLRVKGKQQGITVFTPCSDARLRQLGQQALACYRQGDWPAAVAAWQALAQTCPEDTVAAAFLARLAVMQAQGWPACWDGVTTLESK